MKQTPELMEFERHALYSQGGALVGMMAQGELESLGDVPVSLPDWRFRASKRVLHSTFAAESCAALEAIGLGIYLRAYYLEVLQGSAERPVDGYSEADLRVLLFTDCRSLYDHLKKDGSVPTDRWVAPAWQRSDARCRQDRAVTKRSARHVGFLPGGS